MKQKELFTQQPSKVTFRGKEYVLGDINVKNSGECYKFGNRHVLSKNIYWDETWQRYERINHKQPYPCITKFKVSSIGRVEIAETGYCSYDLGLTVKVNMDKQRWLYPITLGEVPSNLFYNQVKDAYERDYKPERSDAKPRYIIFDTELYSFKDNPGVDWVLDYMEDSGDGTDISNDLNNLVQYSIGLEYETSTGKIPFNELFLSGMIPVKDGSISGHEYVTIPMSNNKGLVEKQSELIKKYCKRDYNCSLHVHYGGIERSYLNAIAIYELCRQVQGEIFQMLPPYKKEHTIIVKRGKDHCQYLPDIGIDSYLSVEDNFMRLYSFYTGDPDPNIDLEYDLYDTETNYSLLDANKWNLPRRYYWINLYNYLLKPSGYSKGIIEFRPHHSVTSYNKIRNWILICNAILEFAEKNAELIVSQTVKFGLNNIFDDVYDDEVSNTLKNYLRLRKRTFFKEMVRRDFSSANEFS